MRIAAILLAAVLALGPSTASGAAARPTAACKKTRSLGKVKPPKQDKCREKCERFNRIAHCADDEGRMIPYSCRCRETARSGSAHLHGHRGAVATGAREARVGQGLGGKALAPKGIGGGTSTAACRLESQAP